MCITKIDKEIKLLQDKIGKLKSEKTALESQTPTERLAIQLHDTLCRWNHTDDCGWFYGVDDGHHNWVESSHSKYLSMAKDVAQHYSGPIKDILEIVSLIEEYS